MLLECGLRLHDLLLSESWHWTCAPATLLFQCCAVMLQSQTWSDFSRWTANKPAAETAVRKLRSMSGRLERQDADGAFVVDLAQQVSMLLTSHLEIDCIKRRCLFFSAVMEMAAVR